MILKKINILIGLNDSGKSKFVTDNDFDKKMSSFEKPETGLHPVKQAEFADYIIESKQECIIETHSPVIINRIGRRIADGSVSISDVLVLLFKNNNPPTPLSFDMEGRIIDFPLGFFIPNKVK